MSRNYSPKTFLRKTPNAILKEYFQKKTLLTDVDFDSLGETNIEPIAQAVEGLTEQQSRDIEAEFRQINDMACVMGVRVLLEEAASPCHKLDLSETFEPMKNHYERAFWVFLCHPSVFAVASDLAVMDRIGSWRRRDVGAGLVPAVAEEDKLALAAAVSEFYKKQGRGHHCKVDNYLRQQPERHCYFVYPEDYATTDIVYDEEGQLGRQPRKPAFEVIFVYKPGSGLLEVSAKGKKKEIEELQEIFCQNILGLNALPDAQGKHFDLTKLTDKNFTFVTEPQDGIEKITIKLLRLDLLGMGNRRITLETSESRKEQAIHSLIEKALNKVNVPLDEVIVAKAKLQFRFTPRDGRKGKTLTFEISIPDRCTLKDDPLDQIAKKYIEKWELVSG